MAYPKNPAAQGLYDPANEHDACGVGFIAHIKGKKSHSIVRHGLEILDNLTHRGATGYDPLLGDGAGILLQIPDVFVRSECDRIGISLPAPGEYGVGMIFLPRGADSRARCEALISGFIDGEGQSLLGWRDVPVDNSGLSDATREVEPTIRQVFVGRGANCRDVDAFERKLFVIRKQVEHAVTAQQLADGKQFYVPSMSARTIVYKGMLLAKQVGEYYLDLGDPQLVSCMALVHQRFSTNTFPSWDLAHPFRMIGHNGEINTLRGNLNWMHARHKAISSTLFGEDLEKIWPLIDEGQSDSACFDNALELLVLGGYSLANAMMLLIPEAWAGNPLMDEKRRAFYEFNAPLMEPWDGPAGVAFTDGRQIGATLDRNGLRPARYVVTKDDLVIMASEVGVLPVPEEQIAQKWRLQPGKMLLIDTEQGRIIDDAEIKEALSSAQDYAAYIEQSRIHLPQLAKVEIEHERHARLLDLQQAFGFTQEDIKFVLTPMAMRSEEAIGSMGNDAPVAVLSARDKPLYNYFKQLFAQVTNPPIDAIREQLVMSLVSFVGPKPNLLGIDEETIDDRLELDQPILDHDNFARLVEIDILTQGKFRSRLLDLTYPVFEGPDGMQSAMDALCDAAQSAVEQGVNILILTDAALSIERVPIPALLATAGVHHHLVREGLRTSTGLVTSTGSAREVHHFALLGGYGAEAIHPWLALDTLHDIAPAIDMESGKAIKHYIKAIGKGLYKVMSKMGISTYQSYCGAQIFEAVGLNSAFIEKYFTGTASNIEGIGIAEISGEAFGEHRKAFSEKDPVLAGALDAGGEFAFRTRGEDHMWTPESIAKLQHATRANEYSTYKEYARLINDQSRRHMTLRGLFEIKPAAAPISVDEVEPWTEIVKRFSTGAMSLGSISTEAHSTLAIAMNRIGGKSNTGEGGEDPLRFTPVKKDSSTREKLGDVVVTDVALKKGDTMRSRIKQVASGRFGVTAEYLSSADQIQIKIAQGAKPGEGGQLPGHKVSSYIAKIRFSVPGVGLISPPPHHDIYSIEDLAQLIHDLKNANPRASVSVKLVSEIGVGTVAAGVSKAKADHVTIAGYDGGTGASPLSSIKHAGTPWELGLAETQQTLVLNRLRGRIAVQVDGQMKTGRDVVIGALLGADEFGFATAPLVVEGCIMMRKCHLNTCPVGVATQDEKLRKKFSGKPEHVINYFHFVAQEVRELMAQMGLRKLDELIGRSDLLDMRKGIGHWKAQGLDFTKIFYRPDMPAEVARFQCETQDHGLDKALDNRLIELARPALENRKKVVIETEVRNINRSVGGMLSGEVARRYGHAGLPDDTIHVHMTGTGGQSFGTFLARGVTFDLQGDANDYVGKGLSGGRIIIQPPEAFSGIPKDNIIVGNTVLYGAIEGEVFFCGVGGERFAVRNSGVTAVIEGVGDHGCEYMTGGTVVVLGETGRNFAAGMSGGIAYVLDESGMFARRCNMAMVKLEPVVAKSEQSSDEPWHRNTADEVLLKELIEAHFSYTGSAVAKVLLDDWQVARAKFVKVFPHEYRRALGELAAKQQKQLEAAYMGKVTGFMEIERVNEASIPVAKRVASYREFVLHLEDDEAGRQGARCMDCGIPFCQTGCPINNIIPDWNDLVYRQQWKSALDTLHSTNNFPEFTGRICPAPCEAACTLNINDDAVAIKSIEHAIIDKGWEEGWIAPQPPARKTGKSVAIVGSGPAGLACAQQLARTGHDVVVFEKNDRIGGLLRYGIPDFKMEKHHIDRRMEQMGAEGVEFRTSVCVGSLPQDLPGVTNFATRFVSHQELLDEFDAIVLTGGAESPRDLAVPGRDLDGIHFAMEFLPQQNCVVAGDAVTEQIKATGKHVVVIGGGDTGSDCVGTSNRQGAVSVTQFELLPMPPAEENRPLTWPDWPIRLRTSSSHEEGCNRDWSITTKRFEGANGIVEKLVAARIEWNKDASGRMQMTEIPGSEFEMRADLVLFAMGFLGPVRTGLIDELGLERDQRGNVKAESDAYRTSNPRVFAAGDMRRGQSLVVWAIREGRQCARAIDEYLMGFSELPR